MIVLGAGYIQSETDLILWLSPCKSRVHCASENIELAKKGTIAIIVCLNGGNYISPVPDDAEYIL